MTGAFQREMNASMVKMFSEILACGQSASADVDFLAMMIPHHVGAVDMALLALIHGKDPATRRFAEDILASQTIEIEGMRRRLALLRAPGALQRPFPELGGTRGRGRG